MLLNHWKYFKYVVKHKYYVALECFKHGLYWRGLIHDIDKFYPNRWFPYVNYTFSEHYKRDKTGYYVPAISKDENFVKAWFLHQKYSEHHWQWWILPYEEGKTKVLPMTPKAKLEMVCDWCGASRAQKNGGWNSERGVKAWYKANKDRMTFHPQTREWIERFLDDK